MVMSQLASFQEAPNSVAKGIAQAEIFFVLVVVAIASQFSGTEIFRPSVFSDVFVPFGGDGGDTIIGTDTFVALGEFFAEAVDSVLGWSGATGNSAVSWEAVTSVVCKSFGDGFRVPAGARFGDSVVNHFHDV